MDEYLKSAQNVFSSDDELQKQLLTLQKDVKKLKKKNKKARKKNQLLTEQLCAVQQERDQYDDEHYDMNVKMAKIDMICNVATSYMPVVDRIVGHLMPTPGYESPKVAQPRLYLPQSAYRRIK